MITNSYHANSKPIIDLHNIGEKHPNKLKACIVNFSHKIKTALIEEGVIEPLAEDAVIKSVACDYQIYCFKGTQIGLVNTTVGAPIASALIEEIGYLFSCQKFVLFGTCGTLDKNIPEGAVILPTHAYRDEGISYHYCPPADYIELTGHTKVKAVFDKLGIKYAMGKTWTTDAFYRETEAEMKLRKQEGCIAVEMEIAACQAVSNYRGTRFYAFLYRGDNIDTENWEHTTTAPNLTHNDRLKMVGLAYEVALAVAD